jgi:hypothetical protein
MMVTRRAGSHTIKMECARCADRALDFEFWRTSHFPSQPAFAITPATLRLQHIHVLGGVSEEAEAAPAIFAFAGIPHNPGLLFENYVNALRALRGAADVYAFTKAFAAVLVTTGPWDVVGWRHHVRAMVNAFDIHVLYGNWNACMRAVFMSANRGGCPMRVAHLAVAEAAEASFAMHALSAGYESASDWLARNATQREEEEEEKELVGVDTGLESEGDED